MKEFTIYVDRKILGLGLRKNLTKYDYRYGLSQCVNMEADEEGLVPYVPIINPFSDDVLDGQAIEWEWPFPQLFVGRGVTILATRNRLFEVDEEWGLHRITCYSADDESNEVEIPSGRLWDFVDLGKSWFMFNGMCAVFSTNKDAMFGGEQKCLVSLSVRVECGCDFHGRLLMGGFSEDHSWSSDWNDFIESYADNNGLSFDFTIRLKENFVWWSSIGGGDLLWLFQKGLAETGFVTTGHGASEAPYSSARPMLFDVMKRNEMGFSPMPFSGMVRKLKQLGDMVIAYGDNGITALVPATYEIGSGFGIKNVCNFGILNVGAVGGDNNIHIFMDKSARLWKLTPELKPELIDGKEFFYSMVNEDVVVHHSQQKKKFFICTNNKTFSIYNDSITETLQAITSVADFGGDMLGIATPDGYFNEEAIIATGNIDFNVNGIKTITRIGLLGVLNSRFFVRIWYAKDKGGAKVASAWIPVNNGGVAFVRVSGVEFKVQVKASDYRNVTINSIMVSYQVSDLRYIRGMYVSASEQGTGQ